MMINMLMLVKENSFTHHWELVLHGHGVMALVTSITGNWCSMT